MTKLFLELLVATKHITKLVILHQQNVGVGLCLTNECQHIKITHYHQSPSSLSILTLLTRVTRQTTVNTDRLNSSNYMSNDLQSQHERITLDRELTEMNSLCVSLIKLLPCLLLKSFSISIFCLCQYYHSSS